MLKIKLSRTGKRHAPSYRVLVMEGQKDPWGDYIENLGIYHPLTEPKTVELKEDRIKYWLSMGAQPSDTVHNLLVSQGIIDAKKRNVSSLGKKAKEEIAKKAEETKAKKEQAKSAKDTPTKEEKETAAEEKKEEQEKEQPAEEKKEEKKTEQPEKKKEEKQEEAKKDETEEKTTESQQEKK